MSAPSRALCALVDERDHEVCQRPTIRSLRDDEPIPASEPARYANSSGYVRLRWKVGVEEYVEAYEHRVVAGRPPFTMQVHHLNRVRDDNRPENLVVLSIVEHARLHQSEDVAKHEAARATRGGYRSVEAFEKATRAAQRREEFRQRSLAMREMYEGGATTTEVGEAFGIDSSNVSRHLRRVGTKMRPFSRWVQ